MRFNPVGVWAILIVLSMFFLVAGFSTQSGDWIAFLSYQLASLGETLGFIDPLRTADQPIFQRPYLVRTLLDPKVIQSNANVAASLRLWCTLSLLVFFAVTIFWTLQPTAHNVARLLTSMTRNQERIVETQKLLARDIASAKSTIETLENKLQPLLKSADHAARSTSHCVDLWNKLAHSIHQSCVELEKVMPKSPLNADIKLDDLDF